MTLLIQAQDSTIKQLELQQASAVLESTHQAALVSKADTSDVKRWLSGVKTEITTLQQQYDDRADILDSISSFVKLDQFCVLEKRGKIADPQP